MRLLKEKGLGVPESIKILSLKKGNSMPCKKLAIIGGGGHAKEVIEIAELNGYEIVGIIAHNSKIEQYPLLGYLGDLERLRKDIDCIHVAIGAVNRDGMLSRNEILANLKNKHYSFATIISPNAYVSKNAQIGKGVYISHFSLVSSDAIIRDNTILNYYSVISHDSDVGENIVISPKSFNGGNTNIKKNVLIGAGSLIMQGLTIGNNSVIGMGSVVREDIDDNCLAFGNPLKIKKL